MNISFSSFTQNKNVSEVEKDTNQTLYFYFTIRLKASIEANTYLRSQVYTFYYNYGYNAIYKIDEQINAIPTNKDSRALFFSNFIYKTFDGKKDAIIDFLYLIVGMEINQAKELGKYIAENYSKEYIIESPPIDTKLLYRSDNPISDNFDNENTENQEIIKGRKTIKLKMPIYSGIEEGKVVVKISVNRNGDVVNAISGALGTTTTDKNLKKAAENAALLCKFSKDTLAPEIQEGTITYKFSLVHK